MGVLVPIRAMVMALVGWVGHYHVGDLTWAPRRIMMIMVVAVSGQVGSVSNTQVTIQKVDV